MEDGRQFPTSRSFVGTATTLRVLPLMMSLFFLPLGCGILGPRTLLEPSELCSDHGNSAIATFEDPNLERAVREWSGVDARNDLTCGRVSGFEGIGLADYGITSLVGIQNLTSLTALELGNNLITDISPLSGLTRLTSLHLYNNSISDIGPLRGLTRLRWLTLRNNSITDISALSGLTRLRELYLRFNNSISDISALRGLTSLTSLDLSKNLDLSNIQPLLDNTGLGKPVPMTFFSRHVNLSHTNVSCTDVAALKRKGVTVAHSCS